MVFYTLGIESMKRKFDCDFGKIIEWDIPLLEGYDYIFTRNVSDKPSSSNFFGIITPDLISEIEKYRPDVVWVWGWSFYGHLRVIFHFHGRLVVWFRGDSTLIDLSVLSLPQKILRSIALKFIYRYVDKVFSVGTHNTLYYKKYGVSSSDIILAPHSVDNARFILHDESILSEALNWRRLLDVRDDMFLLIFVGKFEHKKNPLFFVQVLNKLNSKDYKGLMVGSGVLENEIKSSSENIVFLDFQNQSKMPLIYKMADLLVLPSVGPGETWGLVINEALASGIPVAASIKCGGAIDMIDGNNGFLFDPEDGVESFLIKLAEFRGSTILGFEELFYSKFNYDLIIEAVLKELY
jgi:glycosyltransferase involved in cell wall biosynthesis